MGLTTFQLPPGQGPTLVAVAPGAKAQPLTLVGGHHHHHHHPFALGDATPASAADASMHRTPPTETPFGERPGGVLSRFANVPAPACRTGVSPPEEVALQRARAPRQGGPRPVQLAQPAGVAALYHPARGLSLLPDLRLLGHPLQQQQQQHHPGGVCPPYLGGGPLRPHPQPLVQLAPRPLAARLCSPPLVLSGAP
ncbi:unnamed protein product [Ixodes hexagonus]